MIGAVPEETTDGRTDAEAARALQRGRLPDPRALHRSGRGGARGGALRAAVPRRVREPACIPTSGTGARAATARTWRARSATAGSRTTPSRSLVLRAEIGRLCAQLAGWPGAPHRAGQHHLEAAGRASRSASTRTTATTAGSIPPRMLTCWIALDARRRPRAAPSSTSAARTNGRSRRRSSSSTRRRTIARSCARRPAKVGITPELVPVEVPAGGCAFHRRRHLARLRHQPQPSAPRRSAVVALHVVGGDASTRPSRATSTTATSASAITAMDESVFPDPVAPGRLPHGLARRILRQGSAADIQPMKLVSAR